jgi:fucose 4-O-acetylase-like acetyltransferase
MSTLAAPASAPTGRDRPRHVSRDPFFDNAKLLLVTLVVVGHSWTLLPDVSTSAPVYVFLYSWHVPAFVLVTGYLSRRFTWSRANLRKLVTTVVVPYLVFETLLALFRTVVGGEDFGVLYVSPHWPMWYLTVLFLWRLATPVFTRVRPAVAMALAVAVCLVGGLNTVPALDLPRTFGLLPFFVAGLLVTREQLDRLARPRARAVAAGLLALAFAVSTVVAGHFSKEWLYWRTGYPDLGVPFWVGASVRLGLLVVAGSLALSALALVPRSQRWFTPLGGASLVVYLFHGFFVKAAEYAGVGGASEKDPVTAFLAVTAAAVGLALLLSATPVSRRLNRLVDPISTLGAELDGPAGPLPPDHHRVATVASMALVPRDLTRHG